MTPYPESAELMAYRNFLREQLHARRITYEQFCRKLHKAVREFKKQALHAQACELSAWLTEHQPGSEMRIRADGVAVYTNLEVIKKRKQLLRNYLKQSGLSAPDFLAKLIEAYENFTPTTQQEALAKLFAVRCLRSIGSKGESQ